MRQHNLPPVFNHWCKKFLAKPQPEKIISPEPITNLDNEWIQINSNTISPQLQQEAEAIQLIDVGLVCNNIKLNFSMPITQMVSFVKGLYHATTAA